MNLLPFVLDGQSTFFFGLIFLDRPSPAYRSARGAVKLGLLVAKTGSMVSRTSMLRLPRSRKPICPAGSSPEYTFLDRGLPPPPPLSSFLIGVRADDQSSGISNYHYFLRKRGLLPPPTRSSSVLGKVSRSFPLQSPPRFLTPP